MNKNHLLWWFFEALDKKESVSLDNLKDKEFWKDLNAPDWVLPAIMEKVGDFYL